MRAALLAREDITECRVVLAHLAEQARVAPLPWRPVLCTVIGGLDEHLATVDALIAERDELRRFALSVGSVLARAPVSKAGRRRPWPSTGPGH